MTRLALDRVRELIGLAGQRRIVVVGDAMLDVYLEGDAERISPEAPVPIIRVQNSRYALGGAANVAQNVVAVGSRCDLIAVTGDDEPGAALRRKLQEIGAGHAGVAMVARRTTRKTRIVARAQQMLRIDEEDDADLSAADVATVLARFDEAFERCDAVILEDYNKGVLTVEVIRHVIERARARHVPVIVDPKYRNFFAYRGATIFKPNRRELEAALGAGTEIDDPRSLPAAVERLGVDQILLTLGDRGMVLYSSLGEVVRVPTVAREVYDVVGAGDTVTAYLASILAAGGTSAEAAVIANVAAGIEVGKFGAVSVSGDELLDYVKEHALHV